MVTFDKTGFLHHEKRQLTVFVQKKLISENLRVYFWLIRRAFWRNFSQLLDSNTFHKLATGKSRGIAKRIDSKQWRKSFEWIFPSNMHIPIKLKSLFLVDSAAFWKNFSQVDSIAFHKFATGQSQGIARRIDSKQWRESFEWIFRIKQCMIKTIITRKLSFWCMRQNHYSGKATNRDPPS